VADWTKPRASTDRCQICRGGRTQTLPSHTDNQEDLAQCPDRGIQDMAVDYDIDGCTGSPDNLESWDDFPLAINYDLYVTNPIWGIVEGRKPRSQGTQPVACNLHDVCYQTCGNEKGACDNALSNGIIASCDKGYPPNCPYANTGQCREYELERDSCREIGPVYLSGVDIGGTSAYEQRQRQNCFCCRPGS
jgi:hypothetical protein